MDAFANIPLLPRLAPTKKSCVLPWPVRLPEIQYYNPPPYGNARGDARDD
jgi:hypothetical protein